MDWKSYLTQSEAAELADLESVKLESRRQARRIYDRCQKRMRKNAKMEEAK